MKELLEQLEPEAVSSLETLAKLAVAGAGKAAILAEAERLAELVAYKRSYRRDP